MTVYESAKPTFYRPTSADRDALASAAAELASYMVITTGGSGKPSAHLLNWQSGIGCGSLFMGAYRHAAAAAGRNRGAPRGSCWSGAQR